MPSPEQKFVKELLKKNGIMPLKRLGQNFLVDKRVLQKIIDSADLKPDDVVLEIGPGIGNLTQELAKRVKRIVAVEKDEKMIEVLGEVLNSQKIENVEIIHGDILKIKDGQTLLTTVSKVCPDKKMPYKLVANIPYYLTSPLIRKFLEFAEVGPPQMVLMVQKEVAQRICAKPPKMSILAVSVQFYAKPEIIGYVLKKSFWPKPKVDSAIIKIIPRQPAPYRNEVSGAGFREQFFRIVRAGFSHPRKQLLNNLASGLKLDKEKIKEWLLKNNIKPSQRAETLSIEDWLNLAKSYRIEMKIPNPNAQ